MKQKLFIHFIPLLILLLVGSLFWPTISKHFSATISGSSMNDDICQQIVPFFRVVDSELLQNDRGCDYFQSCMPLGYKSLFSTATLLFKTPIYLSRYLPYLLLLITGVCLSLLLFPSYGFWGIALVLSFLISSELFLLHMAGGLARSFAYPLLAFGFYSIYRGRVYLLSFLIVIGTSFYPSATFPLGVYLAVLLLCLPSSERGSAQAWSFKKRILLVVLTGFLSALTISPNLFALKSYGPSLKVSDEKDFPEMGPKGRYLATERPPFNHFLAQAKVYTKRTFFSRGAPLWKEARKWAFDKEKNRQFPRRKYILLTIYLGLATIGIILSWKKNEGLRRLILFIPVLALIHYLSICLYPLLYLPERYLYYPIPLLIIALFAQGIYEFLSSLGKKPILLNQILAFALSFSSLLLLGGKGSPGSGLSMSLDQPTIHFLNEMNKNLPKSATIAGWPNSLVNFIPLHIQRNAFVTYENHQIFHKAYALEMRKRMEALIDAYFAQDTAPIAKLVKEYKVDYLLLKKDHYIHKPHYFAPFSERTTKAFEEGLQKGFYLQEKGAKAIVLENELFILYDLHLLDK